MPPKTGENRNCTICTKEYYVSGWRLKKGPSIFCGRDCQNNKQYELRRFKFTCFTCKKEFTDSPSRVLSRRKYCSRECLEAQTKSRKEYRQKYAVKRRLSLGNISPNALRKMVWTKKDKKCDKCGYNQYDFCLDVHHIDGNSSNNVIENLAVLCTICHKILHKLGK